MRKIIFLMMCVVLSLKIFAQTVLSYEIDTLFVSAADSKTVVNRQGYVLNVGDTVEATMWYACNDGVTWHILYDFNAQFVRGDSVMIDTLPPFNYYLAGLKIGSSAEYIMWKVRTIEYVSLGAPAVTNDAGIDKDNILLLRDDTIRFYADFDGLQPDRVVWTRNGTTTQMPASQKGVIRCAGYVYNRLGIVIDSAVSAGYQVDFVHPLEAIIFKSWRGSNDGRPKTDTLVIDTCKSEYFIDTLVFAVGDSYKYQFVPVIHRFDKPYDFLYRWEYSGFAMVATKDSVLEFNPVGFEHSGDYRFITYRQTGAGEWRAYRASPLRITAFNTLNDPVNLHALALIEDGVIYDISGRAVKTGLRGLYTDILRRVELPAGVYFLRDNKYSYKFFKY